MTPLLLFVHGWAFDSSLWNAIRAEFPPRDTLAWDLGFFGAPSRPALPANRPIIGVGHSFGLLWLLRQNLPLAGHVAINGFTCFTQRPDFPEGAPPRPLARMQSRLAIAPKTVLTEFRARCGVTEPPPAALSPAALAEGLAALAEWDHRGAPVIAALCGNADPIIPPAMSRVCFGGANIHWQDSGHMLPLTAPAWCAARLRELA